MNHRIFGNTNASVSEIGLGTWQLGTRWGDDFNEVEARSILDTAYENGINLLDTADVYNGGDSEKAIGAFLKTVEKKPFVVTKAGRQLSPHVAEGYSPENIRGFVQESLGRMDVEQLDMVLLHCPPSSVYKKDDLFTTLDKMKEAGTIASYGVSIEKVSEGLAALDYNISAMEVIFNMFRLKPLEELFVKTKAANVGILARVPLASGMLTGRYTAQTTFGADDHRTFNREGAAFDKGETFSGVPYDMGLAAVAELKQLFGAEDLIPYALRWVLMHDAVSVVIPGASKTSQVISNIRAAQMAPLTDAQMAGVQQIYDQYLRAEIHNQW